MHFACKIALAAVFVSCLYLLGKMDQILLGRDFLRHTSRIIHCLEGYFKYLANHKLPLYTKNQLMDLTSRKLIQSVRAISRVEVEDNSSELCSQWQLPVNSVKYLVVEDQVLILYNIADVLVQAHRKPLRPRIIYQVGIILAKQRHEWMTVLTKQVVILLK